MGKSLSSTWSTPEQPPNPSRWCRTGPPTSRNNRNARVSPNSLQTRSSSGRLPGALQLLLQLLTAGIRSILLGSLTCIGMFPLLIIQGIGSRRPDSEAALIAARLGVSAAVLAGKKGTGEAQW